MVEAEFDSVVEDYKAQHAHSVKLSGEETDFFASYKIDIVQQAEAAASSMPQQILDFGAGIGQSTPHLHKAFPQAQINCLDVSAKSLDVCKSLNIPGAQTCHYDGVTLPFENASQDLIFTACVFHHIPASNHIGLLKEINRVLKPGARFYLFEHNPYNPLTQHAVKTCPFDQDAVLITGPEMRQRLIAAGFPNVSLEYRLFFPAAFSGLRFMEPYMTKLPLGAQYSLTAKGKA